MVAAKKIAVEKERQHRKNLEDIAGCLDFD